ncbi:fibroblast growth factor-binding protein 3 [Rhinatrema bivittatum]|uniref:fibroblast growth factor-binding protein 3 n=1 Tax=Rhinatrema bivittatum TaxID=194408 RepID=UPI001126431F|nr:fibroblast growth factor-binding protein 3 [Rhinatrema bivittatum]
MRLPCVLPSIILVCCLSTLQDAAGSKDKQAGRKGETAPFARSGQLSTKDKHSCAWQISGELLVSLAVSCVQHDNSSYQCTYEGEPQRCPSYSAKAKQYWKQILGQVKKKANACETKPLKSRVCKKLAAVESQLMLVQEGAAAPKARGQGKEAKRGRLKEAEKEPDATTSKENVGHGTEKRGKAGKRKSHAKSDPEPSGPPPTNFSTTAREINDEISEFSEDLADTYCAEKWHSLCSFFVNFWNG